MNTSYSSPKNRSSQQKYTWWQWLLPPTFISILTIVFYHPSLVYPFQFDDLANITKKFDIRFFDPYKQILCNSRWVGEWLNKLNYQIGHFDPWYYRACNLSIHIITGLLVFVLIKLLCEKTDKENFLHSRAFWIATTAMTLFLLHPVQTQTVSYVIQARLEGLATLFIITIINLFLLASSSKSIFAKTTLYSLMTFLGFISCGTKEIVIVAPFLLLAVDWFFVAGMEWESFKKRLVIHLIFSLIVLTSLLYYLKPQFFFDVLGLKITTPNNRGNILTDNAMDMIRPFHYLISEFKVILHYLWIFVWPFGMSVEYDWKLVSSFFAPDAFLPLLILLSALGSIVYLAKEKKHPEIAFGLLWFFIAIAPRSTLIPSPELVCDYKTYLASIGWLFILSIGLVMLFEKIMTFNLIPEKITENKVALQLFFVALCAFPLGWSTMNRNKVWGSAVAFWQDIVIKAPKKARGHNNLGVALSEEGRFDESIPYYLQAIKLDNFYSDPWSNLAVAYSVKNEDDKAIAALHEALRIFPNYPEAYNNLGTLHIKKKEYDHAEKMLRQAIALRGWYGKAWFNLGRMYLEQEKPDEAWTYFKKATEGDLDNAEGFHILGQISMQLKKFPEAIHAFENSMHRGAQGPNILFSLANAHFMAEKYDSAAKIYQELIMLAPQDPRFTYNLAESKFALKQFDDAIPLFQKVASAGPDFAHAYVRIAHAYENMKEFEKAKNFLVSVETSYDTEQFKKMVSDELHRLVMQERLITGSGSITLTGEEFKKLIAAKQNVTAAAA